MTGGWKHGSRCTHRAPPGQAVGVFLAVVVAAGVAGGCSRAGRVNRRLDAVDDPAARRIVRDALWRHGSKYRWADCAAIRAEVTRTEHHPGGDAATDQVWLLDPLTGHVRIETPARQSVAVFDGWRLRVFRGTEETTDAAARGQAAGEARLVTEMLAMPLSLARDGLKVRYVGTRTGAGEARTWQRLMVTCDAPSESAAEDQTVVEVRKGSNRVEAVLIRWHDDPFFGRPMRVRLDDWRPAGGLLISRRWRLGPIDEAGAPTGPVLYTVRVRRVEVNPKMDAGAFSRP